ncbi:hypothetical protein, partial [Photorhabdus aegyptia]|uniref:hypothetical protein n=1 Tax=Photorhabdus aegyptia TaxID=2805098 RepID=UPI001E65958F
YLHMHFIFLAFQGISEQYSPKEKYIFLSRGKTCLTGVPLTPKINRLDKKHEIINIFMQLKLAN